LSKKGFTVLEAKSGKEGLDLVRQLAPDLVLLDVRLPDLSGIDVLKKIRELNKNTKIVMLSALDDEGLIEQALKAGASSFLSKTLDIEEIIEAVSQMLP
jgi:DNA-binding NarL/FixJ family response regulator